MTEKFIVHVVGPACSGKSSLAEAIGRLYPETYYVSYDKVKAQLFGYDRDKHREIIHALQKGLFESSCAIGLPLVIDMFLHSEEEFDYFRAVSKKHSYEKVLHVKLDAPREVLLERFQARIDKAKEQGIALPYADEKIFIENLSMRSFVPKEHLEFDTSRTNVDEVASSILKMLTN